jgi:hypothetical protein
MSNVMKAEVISKVKDEKYAKPSVKHTGRPPYPDGTVVISGSYGTEIRYPDGEVYKYSWRTGKEKSKV